MSERQSLAGLRILVLEDEALLSMLIEDVLKDLGCAVLGPFMSLEAARPTALGGSQSVDLAMLDVELGGETSFALADLLRQHRVPVIFTTGHEDSAIEERWRAAPRLLKPFSDEELRRILIEVAATGAG